MTRMLLFCLWLLAACEGTVSVGFDSPTSLDGQPGEATSTDAGMSELPGVQPDASTHKDSGRVVDAERPCERVRIEVAEGTKLFVRASPTSKSEAIKWVRRGYVLRVVETTSGESISGTSQWHEVEYSKSRGYVSGAFTTCTDEPLFEQPLPAGFYLPLPCGVRSTITQGNHGSFSHTGLFAYAWDFRLDIGDPLTAIESGKVIHTYAGTALGSACDGGGSECRNYANHVVLLHEDNTTSTYRHLSKVSVEVGDSVARGQVIGLAGKTGWSTGPHAHVQRMENCGSPFPPNASVCQSIPTHFVDVSGDGNPKAGQSVSSGNCP